MFANFIIWHNKLRLGIAPELKLACPNQSPWHLPVMLIHSVYYPQLILTMASFAQWPCSIAQWPFGVAQWPYCVLSVVVYAPRPSLLPCRCQKRARQRLCQVSSRRQRTKCTALGGSTFTAFSPWLPSLYSSRASGKS